MIDIKDKDLFQKEVIESKNLVIVDFWASWCGPCKAMMPVIEGFSEKNKDVKIVKVNVEDASELAVEYKIRSIPTLIMFKNGEQVSVRNGSLSEETLIQWVEENKG